MKDVAADEWLQVGWAGQAFTPAISNHKKLGFSRWGIYLRG